MNSITWGLCAPATVPSVRRTRSLQLNDTVARFHQLAVPGLGGVWFARQIIMALQGVSIARQLDNGTSNIEAANAIEALCCWQGFEQGGQGDARLRGVRKIKGLNANRVTFNAARKRSFYVTIPMRMGTIEVLPALGLVSPQRSFNAFHCTELGEQLVRLEAAQRKVLSSWIADPDQKAPKGLLSPIAPLSLNARQLIRSQLQHAGGEADRQRRSAALLWVDRLRQSPPAAIRWDKHPKEIAAGHWHDLQAGAYFFATRHAALALLESVESEMAQRSSGMHIDLQLSLPPTLLAAIDAVRQPAQAFLALQHHDAAANQFCHECNQSPAAILRALVQRDGHILKLNGEQIDPGSAFRGAPADAVATNEEEPVEQPVSQDFWPEHISRRIRNLFTLNLDLQGEMSDWLEKRRLS
ncbi:hypothetical protein [Pantoea sp. At-9b]|uniref:hypothetical protein n=1 Tax=Pantoea sp. (strain At-9b) TaxID=592316 RepID=UPI0001B40700|nr:hypothetical protein [Pantoea sp. At-9b]ADU72442.1 hypothetical protein Pat9b_4467 [Pantoea sp. At-9b]